MGDSPAGPQPGGRSAVLETAAVLTVAVPSSLPVGAPHKATARCRNIVTSVFLSC